MIIPEKLNDESLNKFNEFMKQAKKLKKDELLHVLSYWYIELLGAKNLCESYAEENFADKPLHKVASAMKGANLRTCLDETNFKYILSRRTH